MRLSKHITQQEFNSMHSFMIINVSVEGVSALEELADFIGMLGWIAYLVFNNSGSFHEDCVVKLTVLNVHSSGISVDIVKFVYIY